MAQRVDYYSPRSFCEAVAILFELDLITGKREVLNVFRTVKQAKSFRTAHLANKALNLGFDPSYLYPIQMYRVFQTGRGLT